MEPSLHESVHTATLRLVFSGLKVSPWTNIVNTFIKNVYYDTTIISSRSASCMNNSFDKTTCWSFNTSQGKIEGNCDPELFSKRFFSCIKMHKCASAYKHNQKLIVWQSTCIQLLSSPTPMCPSDIMPEKNGPHCHVEGQLSESFFSLEIIAVSNHVEASCCLRTLTNTRWFPSCYTEEIIY